VTCPVRCGKHSVGIANVKKEIRFAIWAVTPATVAVVLLSIACFSLLFYLCFLSLPSGVSWSERQFVGFQNFTRVFSRPETLQSLFLSFAYPIIVTVGALLVGFCVALIVVNRSPRLKPIFVAAIIVPQVIPMLAAGVMWKLIFNTEFGVLNYFLANLFQVRINWLGAASPALFAVILVDIWRSSGFMGLVCLAAMEALPKELFEAASIDGANFLQQIRHIMLPLLFPVILMACILQLVASLHAFDHIFIMTTGGPGSATSLLSLAAYRIGIARGMLGEGSVYALILSILALIVSYGPIRLLRRQFK